MDLLFIIINSSIRLAYLFYWNDNNWGEEEEDNTTTKSRYRIIYYYYYIVVVAVLFVFRGWEPLLQLSTIRTTFVAAALRQPKARTSTV